MNAKDIVAQRFAAAFPDGRFAEDFAQALVDALGDLGLKFEPSAAAPPPAPQVPEPAQAQAQEAIAQQDAATHV